LIETGYVSICGTPGYMWKLIKIAELIPGETRALVRERKTKII
jgi:hypothetical protein